MCIGRGFRMGEGAAASAQKTVTQADILAARRVALLAAVSARVSNKRLGAETAGNLFAFTTFAGGLTREAKEYYRAGWQSARQMRMEDAAIAAAAAALLLAIEGDVALELAANQELTR